jgi:hypothetical protein
MEEVAYPNERIYNFFPSLNITKESESKRIKQNGNIARTG